MGSFCSRRRREVGQCQVDEVKEEEQSLLPQGLLHEHEEEPPPVPEFAVFGGPGLSVCWRGAPSDPQQSPRLREIVATTICMTRSRRLLRCLSGGASYGVPADLQRGQLFTCILF